EAAMYLYMNKPEDAIKMYEKAEEQFGIMDDVALQEYRIYFTINKMDKAADLAGKLIILHPAETKYYHLLAQAYIHGGKVNDAVGVYQKILALNPDDDQAPMALAENYFKNGKKAEAMEMLTKAFANPRISIDAKIQLLYSRYLMEERNP